MAQRLAILVLFCACATSAPPGPGTLRARPHPNAAQCAAGQRMMGEAVLYVPPAVAAKAPLLVLLHGAGGNPHTVVDRYRGLADEHGVILVAPKSRAVTWDAIGGPLGPDVSSIDSTLAAVFDSCSIDPSRLAIGGFSDGASYALTLGLANGSLFSHILAFAACIIASEIVPHGLPRIFLSHGTADEIMPVDHCGRRLAAQLREMNYPLRYEEFRGGHQVPPRIAAEAFDWFAGRTIRSR